MHMVLDSLGFGPCLEVEKLGNRGVSVKDLYTLHDQMINDFFLA